MIKDLDLFLFGDSIAIFKIFLSTFTPLVVILLFVALWLMVKGIFRRRVDLNGVVMSVVIIVYFLHSTITDIMLGLFRCYPVEGKSLLEKDMTVECWSSSHMAWALGLGVPYIAVWTIGIPLAGIAFLWYY